MDEKKAYESPECEVISFGEDDIITNSDTRLPEVEVNSWVRTYFNLY